MIFALHHKITIIKEGVAVSLILGSKKGGIGLNIELAFTILIIAAVITGVAFNSTYAKETLNNLKDDEVITGPLADEVVEQADRQTSNMDWGVVAILIILWGGSLFVIYQSENTMLSTAIAILLIIVVGLGAAYLSNAWEEQVNTTPSLATEFPRTDYILQNYVSVCVLIALTQIGVGIIAGRYQ